ncbi:hypothetical protein B0O80DRAFT_191638 [Mortierella sp. GBAus27b]|nr:hypothetical protein B0O80DRAFT_191638 [Mortierella sp. GBAus27b]
MDGFFQMARYQTGGSNFCLCQFSRRTSFFFTILALRPLLLSILHTPQITAHTSTTHPTLHQSTTPTTATLQLLGIERHSRSDTVPGSTCTTQLNTEHVNTQSVLLITISPPSNSDCDRL